MGLNKEADYLDQIIYKLAESMSGSDFTIERINGMELKVDTIVKKILQKYSQFPKEFSSWLLTNPQDKKIASLFFQINIWNDFGLEYIKNLSFPSTKVYEDLLLMLGAKVDNAYQPDTSKFNWILYNIKNYQVGNTAAMVSPDRISSVEKTNAAINLFNPIEGYKSVQNPAVAAEAKRILTDVTTLDSNSSMIDIITNLFLSAPLTLAKGIINLETGNYKEGALDVLDATIQTLISYGLAKLAKNIAKPETVKFFASQVVEIAAGTITSKAKEAILSDPNISPQDQRLLIVELDKVPEEVIREKLNRASAKI